MKQLLFTMSLIVLGQNSAIALPGSYELIKCQGTNELGIPVQLSLYSNIEETTWQAFSTAYITLGSQETALEIDNILIGNSWKEDGPNELKTYDTLEEGNSEFEFHGTHILGDNKGQAEIRFRNYKAKDLSCTFE